MKISKEELMHCRLQAWLRENKSDDVGGTSGTEDVVTEVSLAFAF